MYRYEGEYVEEVKVNCNFVCNKPHLPHLVIQLRHFVHVMTEYARKSVKKFHLQIDCESRNK